MGSPSCRAKAGSCEGLCSMKSDGMPDMSSKDKPGIITVIVMLTVPVMLGVAIAVAIFHLGDHAKYVKNMAALGEDYQYGYLAADILGFVVHFVNFYPMVHKGAIMTSGSKNLRSNPFILKAIGTNAAPNYVIFDEEGDVGKYNRANRSLHHMVENFGVVVAGLFMCSKVFPLPTLVLVLIWGLGRMLHQVGYTLGYGTHAPGFLLTMIATMTIKGLCAVTAFHGFGWA